MAEASGSGASLALTSVLQTMRMRGTPVSDSLASSSRLLWK
jgi:hypothetical protein